MKLYIKSGLNYSTKKHWMLAGHRIRDWQIASLQWLKTKPVESNRLALQNRFKIQFL
jgi:hypothetical protein